MDYLLVEKTCVWLGPNATVFWALCLSPVSMILNPSCYCFGVMCCYLDNCKVSLMSVKWKDFKLYCLFHPFIFDQLCWWNVIADLPSCVRTFWRRTRCPRLCLQSICCPLCWRCGTIPSPMYVWRWPESWLSALFLSVSGALQSSPPPDIEADGILFKEHRGHSWKEGSMQHYTEYPIRQFGATDLCHQERELLLLVETWQALPTRWRASANCPPVGVPPTNLYMLVRKNEEGNKRHTVGCFTPLSDNHLIKRKIMF